MKFEHLFGIPSKDVRPLCILMPFLAKPINQELGITEFHKGKPYASACHEKLTLIETRIGPLFTGDAILALKDSPCKTILFIGSCGTLDPSRFPIGSLVLPKAAYAMESFSEMVFNRAVLTHNIPVPSSPLAGLLSRHAVSVQCASTGSIQLEGQFRSLFIKHHIDVIDMECASVFSAATVSKLSAASLLYVADVVGETSPYDTPDSAAARAQIQIAKIIKEIVNVFA